MRRQASGGFLRISGSRLVCLLRRRLFQGPLARVGPGRVKFLMCIGMVWIAAKEDTPDRLDLRQISPVPPAPHAARRHTAGLAELIITPTFRIFFWSGSMIQMPGQHGREGAFRPARRILVVQLPFGFHDLPRCRRASPPLPFRSEHGAYHRVGSIVKGTKPMLYAAFYAGMTFSYAGAAREAFRMGHAQLALWYLTMAVIAGGWPPATRSVCDVPPRGVHWSGAENVRFPCHAAVDWRQCSPFRARNHLG